LAAWGQVSSRKAFVLR